MFFSGAESRTTSRTFAKKEAHHIEQLVEAAASPEVARLYEMFMDGYRKAGGFETDQAGKKLTKPEQISVNNDYLDNTSHS